MEKEYIIYVSTAGNKTTRVAKKEEELTKQDYDLFLGNLINSWDKSPEKTKLEFMTKIIKIV